MQSGILTALETYAPEKGISDILQAYWRRSDSNQNWQTTSNLLGGMTCILEVYTPIYEELAFLESIANERALMAITGRMHHV